MTWQEQKVADMTASYGVINVVCPVCGELDEFDFEREDLDKAVTFDCGYCGARLSYELSFRLQYDAKEKEKTDA